MSRLTYGSKDGSWGLKGLSWEQHGLGCLPQLARLGGALVTTEVLRDALTGAVKLPLHTWRAIGKALDKAEQQENADE